MRLCRLESTSRIRVENASTGETIPVESVFNGNISESSVMDHSDHSESEIENVKLQHDIESILGKKRGARATSPGVFLTSESCFTPKYN